MTRKGDTREGGLYSMSKFDRKERDALYYVTLKVKRPLSQQEKLYLSTLSDEAFRKWETERLSLMFEIAVLANNTVHAEGRLRNMLRSPELIIEDAGIERNGNAFGILGVVSTSVGDNCERKEEVSAPE